MTYEEIYMKMLHSVLYERLDAFRAEQDQRMADFIKQLLIDTSQGVNEEGGLIDPIPEKTSGFVFSDHSLGELKGVRSELVSLAIRALELTTQDFIVFDGLRTLAEQHKLVLQGKSQTLESKHLTGNAIDAVPWEGGKPVWSAELCYRIAIAFYNAACEQKMLNKIRWGAVWDRGFFSLLPAPASWADMKIQAESYTQRRKLVGKSAFIDAVHFEWVD